MEKAFLYARGACGVMLFILWGLFGSPLVCVLLLLALAALTITRYRIRPYRWLAAAETASCLLVALAWPAALSGLWLPLLSLLENRWLAREAEIRSEAETDRARLLQLERQRGELLAASARAAAEAEARERGRIAQDIHDHVGHEISGALIALQTVRRLADTGRDDDARALLPQAVERLAGAQEHLRETVHNLKPGQTADAAQLGELCARFVFCPAGFDAQGELSDVTAAQWQLLTAVLKEALTNIARHSNATEAAVRLDGGRQHIRLAVRDNGSGSRGNPTLGLGLSGMRDRAAAAGGSLSVSAEDGFQIVCVLPKKEESM